MNPAQGAVIKNRYKLLDSLGEGGFAFVWQAHDLELDRIVAIKFLKVPDSDPASLAELVQRLKREAKLLAKTSHPNIVSVFAIDLLDDLTPFIVMEYVTGSSLAKVLALKGKLDCSLTAEITKQICAGLGSAHASGMIHRDLSSTNILLCGDETVPTVKLIDFGLSRSSLSTSAKITRTGLMMGNPAYMSPESIIGTELDCRADIYSLGCIVYEMLTGKQPFQTDSVVGLLYQHQSDYPPAPSCLSDDMNATERICAITLRCLQKNRDFRFASCQQIIDAFVMEQSVEEILPMKLGSSLVRSWAGDTKKPPPALGLRYRAGLTIVSITIILLVVFAIKLANKRTESLPLTLSAETRIKNHKSKLGLELPVSDQERVLRLKAKARADLAAHKADRARVIFQQVLRMQIDEKGESHPDTLQTYVDLTELELQVARYEDVNKYAQYVIEHTIPAKQTNQKARSESLDELRSRALFLLAKSYFDRGQIKDSEKLATQSLAAARVQAIDAQVLRADCQLCLGKLKEAKASYANILADVRENVHYMIAQLALSAILEYEGSITKANELRSRAADFSEKDSLQAHYAQRMFDLGMRFYYLEKLDEAERLYLDSISMIDKHLDKGFEYIKHADLHWLGELYFKRGEIEKATAKYKEVLAFEKSKGIRSWRGDDSIGRLQNIYKQAGNAGAAAELELLLKARSKLPKV